MYVCMCGAYIITRTDVSAGERTRAYGPQAVHICDRSWSADLDSCVSFFFSFHDKSFPLSRPRPRLHCLGGVRIRELRPRARQTPAPQPAPKSSPSKSTVRVMSYRHVIPTRTVNVRQTSSGFTSFTCLIFSRTIVEKYRWECDFPLTTIKDIILKRTLKKNYYSRDSQLVATIVNKY